MADHETIEQIRGLVQASEDRTHRHIAAVSGKVDAVRRELSTDLAALRQQHHDLDVKAAVTKQKVGMLTLLGMGSGAGGGLLLERLRDWFTG